MGHRSNLPLFYQEEKWVFITLNTDTEVVKPRAESWIPHFQAARFSKFLSLYSIVLVATGVSLTHLSLIKT